ncbi:MAG: insulinase family protein, partial [Acidobacteriota bacterium]|nr:insulinase family protein [Acidobacteriota bacterium]
EISDAELAVAKDSLARSLPGEFEATSSSASSIGQLFVHGLPLDHYEDLPGEIDQVSAADVRRMAEEHLKPEGSVIVAVGDRRQIEPELAKLALGPIEVLER